MQVREGPDRHGRHPTAVADFRRGPRLRVSEWHAVACRRAPSQASPRHAAPHLILPHLTSPPLTSPHPPSPPLTSPHLASHARPRPRPPLPRLTFRTSPQRILRDANTMRATGTRIEVANKNIGYYKYSFNPLQVSTEPKAHTHNHRTTTANHHRKPSLPPAPPPSPSPSSSPSLPPPPH